MSYRLSIEIKDMDCQAFKMKRKAVLWRTLLDKLHKRSPACCNILDKILIHLTKNATLVTSWCLLPWNSCLMCPRHLVLCSVLWRRHRRRHHPHPDPAGPHHRPHRVLRQAQEEPSEQQKRGTATQFCLKRTRVCVYRCVLCAHS